METGKHSNSEKISSPKNDQNPEQSNEDTTGVGRSYECTFCKRGFTNAQALGGHMNIHRKDKAKAKQKNQEGSSKIDHKIRPNENLPNNLRYVPQTDHYHHHHHHQQQRSYNYNRPVNYQVYLPNSSNPSFQSGAYLPIWRPQQLIEGQVDANLSLTIGLSPPVDDGEDDRNVDKEDEVDLELRLGHDP